MMALPDYAMSWHTAFTSPASGVKITANSITVAVSNTGYQLSCAWAGKPNQAGFGHYHLLLDKALVNMFCTPQATVSLQNVKPGMHNLTVVPALDDHAEVEMNGQTLSFDYEPTNPLQVIADATSTAKPSIKILSPASGAVVSGAFDVSLQVTGYNLSCDLYGKPDLFGYGHWHLNLDSLSGPMMGMAGMMGMSCQNVIHVSTIGLHSGETHTLIAVLVGNGHAPLMPEVIDKVNVTIG
jgi:hypothetical protein